MARPNERRHQLFVSLLLQPTSSPSEMPSSQVRLEYSMSSLSGDVRTLVTPFGTVFSTLPLPQTAHGLSNNATRAKVLLCERKH